MKKILILVSTIALLLSGCGKDSTQKAAAPKKDYSLFKNGNKPTPPPSPTPEAKPTSQPKTTRERCIGKEIVAEHLDFEAENQTGKTIYVTCFTYIQKESILRWRWDKSPVYKLEPGQKTMIDIDTIPDEANRQYIFGYLAVFENEQQAQESIYELLSDENKIDLDQIYKLQKKTVTIKVEKYGFKKEKLDFSIDDQDKKKAPISELDFAIENQTGKTIYTTAFIYQVKDNIRMVWGYDKTPLQKLEPGQQSIVDISSIINPRDQEYVNGYLAVFDDYEEEKAQNSTYELLDKKNRLSLGRISLLGGKKVIIKVEQYGSLGQISDLAIQPAQSPIDRMKQPIKIEKKAPVVEVKPTEVVETQKALPKRNKGAYQFFAKS